MDPRANQFEMTMSLDDDFECDVLVIGSGASGFSTAITAAAHGMRVLVIEKAARFGGSTARSGGWVWIPCTSLAKEWGITDDPGAARAYIRQEAGEFFNAERVDAFLENGPRALNFFLTRTKLRFDMPLIFPDYHAEIAGGVQGGRSMLSRPFDGRELGERFKDLDRPIPELTLFGMALGSGKEFVHFMNASKSFASAVYVARRLSKHFMDLLRYRRGTRLSNGNGLAARLAKSAFDLGVDLWLNTPATKLTILNGVVCGATIERNGKPFKVKARKGVVLACGGFPNDVERRKAHYRHAPTGAEHVSPSSPHDTGDGLRLAEQVGGVFDARLHHPAAWVPVSQPVRKDGSRGVMPHFIDRAKPGVIAVLRNGQRFVNEALSYHDFAQAMASACEKQSEVCAFLVCDHKALRKYGLGCVPPFPLPIGRHLRSGYLMRGPTIAKLASAAGIDETQLIATIEAFNEHAREGRDPHFGKGTESYNRFQGDARHSPNPCVAPLDRGPFYAIKLVMGDSGTYAGLTVDEHGRVLDREGKPVQSLYAVGNDAVSVMGGSYPAAGTQLGPALIFGYIAGRSLAGAVVQAGSNTSPVTSSAASNTE